MINRKGMFYGSLVEKAIMREGSLATVIWLQAKRPKESAFLPLGSRIKGTVKKEVPVEKVRGELLVETVVNVLMPKVVPALIIGYIVWEQTNSAMIYQSISEYTMSSLSTVKPIKKDLEEIARAATEGGSAAGTSEPAKMLLQTVVLLESV